MELLPIIGLGVLAGILVRKNASSRNETFIPPALAELNYGRDSNLYADPRIPRDIVLQRRLGYPPVGSGPIIENFFSESIHDPIYTLYSSVEKPPIAASKRYGPRAWTNNKNFDDTGAVEYESTDVYGGVGRDHGVFSA